MKIFFNKFIPIFLTLVLGGEVSIKAEDIDNTTKSYEDFYIEKLTFFSPEDVSIRNLKKPKIREHIQILFIDEVLLGWIKKHKVLPSRTNLNPEDYEELQLSLYKLVDTKTFGSLGLFVSFQDMKEKILKRIKDLDLEEEYSFLFHIRIDDNFTLNTRDLNSEEKRSEIQAYVIDNYILPWIDKYKKFPSTLNFNRKPTGIAIMPRVLFTVYIDSHDLQKIGIFDSIHHLKNVFYSRIIELGLEDRYLYLENTNHMMQSLALADLNDPVVKAQVQRTFILKYVIPWILTNHRFPNYSDFKITEKCIGASYTKIFRPTKQNPALFTNLDEFKKLVSVVIYEEGLDKTNPELVNITLSKELFDKKNYSANYQTPKERLQLQKTFIQKYILPWIETHNKIPELSDFGTEEGKIGISHSKIFPVNHHEKALFESIYDLRKKIFLVFKELNLIDLRESILEQTLISEKLTSSELDDPHTKQLLQNICIKEYIIPWIEQHNGIFPSTKDFGTDTEKVGISYSKIFGEKKSDGRNNQGLFTSMLELKEKTLLILRQNKLKQYRYDSLKYKPIEPGSRSLDYPISQKDLRIPSRRKVLQRLSLREYILPWSHRHLGATPEEKDFGTESDQIGLSYQTVFGTTLEDGTTILGIFNSMEEIRQELLGCVNLFIENMNH